MDPSSHSPRKVINTNNNNNNNTNNTNNSLTSSPFRGESFDLPESSSALTVNEDVYELENEMNYDLIFGLPSNDSNQEILQKDQQQQQQQQQQEEENRRKDRLELNNSFRIAFNNGDFKQLLTIMKEHCHPEIHFLAPNLFLDSYGIYPLFAFFMFVAEVYPDSAVKFIDKRIATMKISKPPAGSSVTTPPAMPAPTEVVEIIDKFTGTRVLENSVVGVFRTFLQKDLAPRQHQELSVSQIAQLLSAVIHADESIRIAEGKLYSNITETKLTFDITTNKILEWSYTILAVHTDSN